MVIKNLTSWLLASGLAAVAATGCKWTDFDDLEKDTWVTSTEKPNDDSTDYAVAIQRGSLTSDIGGKLVVIGAGQAQFTELVYSSTGTAELAPTALKLNSQFGVGNLDPEPILLAHPMSDEVALLANTGGNQVSALIGSGGLNPFIAHGPNQADAGTYMKPPPRADQAGVEQPIQPIIAEAGTVYATWVSGRPAGNVAELQCLLQDGAAAPVTISAIAAAPIAQATHDDLIVWTSTGKLILYPGAVHNGAPPFGPCAGGVHGPLAGSVEIDTGFLPARNSQILMVDNRFAVLVGQKDGSDTAGFLAVYDVTAMNATPAFEPAMLGTPITQPDLRSAALLSIPQPAGGLDHYVVAGYPTATFDAAQAGRVLVFSLDLTAGLDATPVLTLHDAQPEGGQAFGRAVAVMPFNGHPVIAVAANNEVFLYFRTLLYDETRDGQ